MPRWVKPRSRLRRHGSRERKTVPKVCRTDVWHETRGKAGRHVAGGESVRGKRRDMEQPRLGSPGCPVILVDDRVRPVGQSISGDPS